MFNLHFVHLCNFLKTNFKYFPVKLPKPTLAKRHHTLNSFLIRSIMLLASNHTMLCLFFFFKSTF